MGAIQKFDNELLTQAVTEYAGIESGIIKTTELAKWARENIKGLQNVEAYHFRRKIIQKDPKTGKKREVLRPCTEKINELNNLRKVSVSIETNPLIHSSSVDEIFQYDKSAQRQFIMDTRAQFDKIKAHNEYLSRENVRYKNENELLRAKVEELSHTLDELAEEAERVTSMISRIVDFVDEKQRLEVLEEMGIKDGDFDFQKFMDSMTVHLQNAFSIKKAILSAEKTTCVRKTEFSIEGMDWDE